MTHTPFGYEIKNGEIIVNEENAETVRKIFSNYLSGMSLRKAAAEAGRPMTHSGVKKMMDNRRYLGDKGYPAIISKEIFDQIHEELDRRKTAMGRDHRGTKPRRKVKIATQFKIPKIRKRFDDPVVQAEYAYSRIEKM